MYPSLLLLLALPFLVFGQSSSSTSNSASASNSASSNSSSSASGSSTSGGSSSTAFTTITSTSLSTFLGIVTSGGNRIDSTIVSTHVFTTVQPVSTGNSSASNSATSSSTTTTPRNLPTAPSDVNGGGQGGAPVPGAKTGNGAFGPDDNYIAAAAGLAARALLASAVACVVGGALVL